MQPSKSSAFRRNKAFDSLRPVHKAREGLQLIWQSPDGLFVVNNSFVLVSQHMQEARRQGRPAGCLQRLMTP